MTNRDLNELWSAVDQLIDRAPRLQDLRAHRLHLLAAALWRRERRAIPDALADEQFRSALLVARRNAVLELVRDTVDGRMLVLKGPHTASYYPAPHLRPYSDLDLLVDDPIRVQAELISRGFVPIGLSEEQYARHHHLQPLRPPHEHQLMIELHRRPNWVRWAPPPSNDELFSAAVLDELEVPGVLSLQPAQHALVLASHAWTTLPLMRVLNLVDIAAVAARAEPSAIDELASRWSLAGLWATTSAAVDALFFNARQPVAMRIWARNLTRVTELSPHEINMRLLFSWFWVLPPRRAVDAMIQALTADEIPIAPGSWRDRVCRAGWLNLRSNEPRAS